MVVGLLVLLAMVGTTFIIVAHMDRREAYSIATSAPMKRVAGGFLQQIRIKLADDLYINGSNVIYGDATNYKQQGDCPHEDYDKHLASFAPVSLGGVLTWRHISNHNDIGVFVDVLANDPLLVDTDGYRNDGTNAGDAILFNSGVGNRSGGEYWVAVRIVDASSLMNVNSAYSSTIDAAAAAGVVMPVTNIALDALVGTSVRDSVHDARNGSTTDNIATYNTNYVRRPLNPVVNIYRPFDVSDMTALLWGGTVPNTASGRLWEALGAQFNAAKPYLTVHSASRDYVRQVPGGVNDPLPNNRRVDLNNAGFVDLSKAFYNAIPMNVPGFPAGAPGRRTVAAQLAANVIDYRDGDDTPYRPTILEMAAAGLAPGTTLFGVERQPFITEAWLRMEWDAAVPPGSVKQWSAIELFNPYKTAISLVGYKLKVGAGAANNFQNLPPGNMLPAGGRIVIVSSAAEIRAVTKYQDTNLDLRETCTIFRTASGGALVPVGSVESAKIGLTVPTAFTPEAVYARIRRDDAVARAKYSVAVYSTQPYTYRIGDGGCPDETSTNLGRSNSGVDLGAAVAPTPVFVRNGKLINLGEVSRIFYVGPKSDGTPLDEVLASLSPGHVSNGRLYMLGALQAGGWGNPNIPNIPPICMLGDYMGALTPDPANTGRIDTVYGRININTAPWPVIRYLPGISAMAQRDRIAKDIVAYRDLLDNTAAGGTDYSAAGARAAASGIANLRPDAGFACPGEIGIPLARIVTPMPNNTYNTSAPNCYKVAGGSDDGLDGITDDLSKRDIYYAWLSNQITVRSDVYIAYIRVQIGSDPATTGAVRKYVAVIDRSNCASPTDLPDVLMFAEMK